MAGSFDLGGEPLGGLAKGRFDSGFRLEGYGLSGGYGQVQREKPAEE